MTAQPRPLTGLQAQELLVCNNNNNNNNNDNNNRFLSVVSHTVVHNCCNFCASSGYSSVILPQNLPKTSQPCCHPGVMHCSKGYPSEANPQKLLFVCQQCCPRNSIYPTRLSDSHNESSACYQSCFKCGKDRYQSSSISEKSKRSYKCHYACYKCCNIRDVSDRAASKICCHPCFKRSERDASLPGNSGTLAYNCNHTCSICRNNVYLQLVPTIAARVDTSPSSAVPVPHFAPVLVEM